MKFLFFRIRQICYNSNGFFVTSLARQLQSLGHQVQIFDSSKQPLSQLETLCGQSFDAIIDFNSNLTRVQTDENRYFLDTINGPFYHWILDHPLYHHDTLAVHLGNEHVLCLDRDHVTYIKTYYPHIKSAHFLPLWSMDDSPISTDDSGISTEERAFDLLFTGTYTEPSHYGKLIDGFDPDVSSEMWELIHMLLETPELTVEQAFHQYLGDHHLELTGSHFAKRMHIYFLVDSYITAFVRKQAAMALVKDHVPFTAIGKGWEYFPLRDAKNFHDLGPKPFREANHYASQAKMLLNVQPWFKNGVHDRVFTAMHSGAISVTDSSRYLTDSFQSGKELLIWSLRDYPGLSHMVHDYLLKPDVCYQIAQNAFMETEQCHTLSHRTYQLLQIITREATHNESHT